MFKNQATCLAKQILQPEPSLDMRFSQKVRRPIRFSYSGEKSIYQRSRFYEITHF